MLTTFAVVAAVLGSALVGGIFFAFSNFVMKALARVPFPDGIATMQAINIVVLNRWFLGVFMGTAAVSLLLAGIAITRWEASSSPWLLGGAVAYVIGTWLVTIVGNVPLNQQLAQVGPSDPAAVPIWDHYLDRWTKLNSQRALGSILSAALFSVGLLL
jgi:uncharacterized membrane protein